MKKIIVITSAIISIVSSVCLTICLVRSLGASIVYGYYGYHAVWRGPIDNFAVSIIMELLIVFISLLVIFNIKPPKLLRILFVTISAIIVIMSIIIAGLSVFVIIKGNIFIEYFIFLVCVSIAIVITLLTYIIRTLKLTVPTTDSGGGKDKK